MLNIYWQLYDSSVQKEGGFISEKDLTDHHSDWIGPVSPNYRGYDVWELLSNGPGLALVVYYGGSENRKDGEASGY